MVSERLDIVDASDTPIGVEERERVHQIGAWHRGVHVLLFTSDGDLIVQRRSSDRSEAPGALDCSISEHVRAGESYAAAAIRGLDEELSLTRVALEPVVHFRLDYGPNDNMVSVVSTGTIEDPDSLHLDRTEVAEIFCLGRPELDALLTTGSYQLSRWFEQILRWYLGHPNQLDVIERFDVQVNHENLSLRCRST